MIFAVCDDSVRDRASTIQLIKRFMDVHNEPGEILEFDSCQKLLKHVSTNSVDLVFLDIYMESLNGIDAAAELRKKGYQGGLIFISSSRDYAVDSYQVHADYYLVKPVSYMNFIDALSAYVEKHSYQAESQSPSLRIIQDRHSLELPLLTISYVEIYNRMLTIHCLAQKYHTYGTLESILKNLDSNYFIRIHRSYIINMYFIKEMQKNHVILKNDITIPISRRINKDVHNTYNHFLNQCLWKD